MAIEPRKEVLSVGRDPDVMNLHAIELHRHFFFRLQWQETMQNDNIKVQ
jgi:hypothetical protein